MNIENWSKRIAVAAPRAVALDEGLFVGPELDRRGIERLSRAGFRSIVNVADEGEPGQILSPNVEATWAHTFELVHARMSAGPFPGREEVDRLGQVLAGLPRPIYLHATQDERALALALAATALRHGWNAEHALRQSEARGALPSDFVTHFLLEVIDRELPAAASSLA